MSYQIDPGAYGASLGYAQGAEKRAQKWEARAQKWEAYAHNLEARVEDLENALSDWIDGNRHFRVRAYGAEATLSAFASKVDKRLLDRLTEENRVAAEAKVLDQFKDVVDPKAAREARKARQQEEAKRLAAAQAEAQRIARESSLGYKISRLFSKD